MSNPRPTSPEINPKLPRDATSVFASVVVDQVMRAPRGAVHVHTIGAQNVSETAQKVAKDVIAASTVQKRGGLPMPVETGDATGRVHSTATDEEIVELEADSKWMEGLQLNATGRKLCDYLGHVTSVLDDGDLGTECPIDQACSFRRVLIRALETKETPFGLSKKLPNFIAMVQLCGERMLLTTDRSQLFQLLAHAPSGARANSNAVCVRASGLALELPNASDPWAADHQGCQLFADPDGGAGLDEGLPSLCLPRSRSYRESLAQGARAAEQSGGNALVFVRRPTASTSAHIAVATTEQTASVPPIKCGRARSPATPASRLSPAVHSGAPEQRSRAR